MQDQSTEVWREIPGTNGGYSVSSLGRVRSEPLPGPRPPGHPRGKVLRPSSDRDGYLHFGIWENAKRRDMKVHQAVALAFLGPCPEGMQVNHLDGVKTNNLPENLEYVTAQDNTRHAVRMGLRRRKLTEEDVVEIRRSFPGMTMLAIARKYNVVVSTIALIIHRRTWTHVA